jgi:hypothetical protein
MEADPFTGKPTAESLYRTLRKRVQEIAPSTEELKKTSLHVVAGSGAFLGVHPGPEAISLNIVLDHAIVSPRLSKAEQVSKSRYHNEVKITGKAEIDDELLAWIGGAYGLKTLWVPAGAIISVPTAAS